MAEQKMVTLDPPAEAGKQDKQPAPAAQKGQAVNVKGVGPASGSQTEQPSPSPDEKPRVKLSIPERIALIRGKIVSGALSLVQRAGGVFKPGGAGMWVLFVIVSLLIFFGSLQFAGVFNPKTFVTDTVKTARKIEVKDTLKTKTQRAVEITKGGFSVIGRGFTQFQKIPAFFAVSYQKYKSWKKQREMDILARREKKLRFEQSKLNQDKKGLEKQKTNLLKQEDEVKAEKIKTLQEQKRLEQFRDELKKREKTLAKTKVKEEEQSVAVEGVKKKEAKTSSQGVVNEKNEDEESLASIERLADIYKNMPPDQAAEIVKEIDDDLVMAIFAQMKERNVARIIGEMEPQKAAEITKKMSGK